MTTVTLNLPDNIVLRADKMAQILHHSLEEVLTATLANTLPDVGDAPAGMQTELLRMTWLNDRELLQIAQSRLSEKEQMLLASLSERQGAGQAVPEEQQAVTELRERYGQITLRKARAYALLSIRGGSPLLDEPGNG